MKLKKDNSTADFHNFDVYHLYKLDKQYDAFFAAALFLHIPKTKAVQALASIKDVLKPGGVGFISLKDGAGQAVQEQIGRLNVFYSADEFATVIAHAGLTLIKQEKRERGNSYDSSWLMFFVQKDK